MQTTTLRPGLLVSLKTSIKGNVSYQARTLEPEHTDGDGATREKWETTRTIADAKEFEDAGKVRAEARAIIARICAQSAFGLLCPQARANELSQAVAEAQRLADAFNERASVTVVSVYVITGKIAADDVEAVKAINSEVRDLLDRMEEGVRRLDVETIRDAAKRAKSLESMITPEASARLVKAIDSARTAARAIVKAGESAAIEVDQQTLRTIKESRTMFLDLAEAREIQAPIVTGRALDLDITAPTPVKATAPRTPQIEV